MKPEFRCALDDRERELRERGYVSQKAYFRFGRSIFVFEPLAPGSEELPPWARKKGGVKIIVEGDPDAGMEDYADSVVLTGYKHGLDSILVDGHLVLTVKGPFAEPYKYFADVLEKYGMLSAAVGKRRLSWRIKLAVWALRRAIKAIEKDEMNTEWSEMEGV